MAKQDWLDYCAVLTPTQVRAVYELERDRAHRYGRRTETGRDSAAAVEACREIAARRGFELD